MKIQKTAFLLLALALTLVAAPAALPAWGGAYCEGECNSNEVLISCSWTTSAAACCNWANSICGSFSGVCTGDAELFCP